MAAVQFEALPHVASRRQWSLRYIEWVLITAPRVSPQPMADESFKEFVLDQLRALPDLCARAMFGGHGLYQDGQFFAILIDGRLFLRTDRESRADFTTRGMSPFTYEQRGRVTSMQYYEVPPEILENPRDLVAWARRAVSAAVGARQLRQSPRPKRTGRNSWGA